MVIVVLCPAPVSARMCHQLNLPGCDRQSGPGLCPEADDGRIGLLQQLKQSLQYAGLDTDALIVCLDCKHKRVSRHEGLIHTELEPALVAELGRAGETIGENLPKPETVAKHVRRSQVGVCLDDMLDAVSLARQIEQPAAIHHVLDRKWVLPERDRAHLALA